MWYPGSDLGYKFQADYAVTLRFPLQNSFSLVYGFKCFIAVRKLAEDGWAGRFNLMQSRIVELLQNLLFEFCKLVVKVLFKFKFSYINLKLNYIQTIENTYPKFNTFQVFYWELLLFMIFWSINIDNVIYYI